MKNSAAKKLILTVCISSLFVIAAAFLFGWLVIHIQTVTQSLEKVQIQMAEHEAERTNARETEVKLEENKAAIARVHTTFINHDRPIEFLEELTRLGKDTGNTIVLDYSEQESDKESLVFRITLDGSKLSVLRYLSVLELTPYVITIENINWQNMIEGNAAGGGSPINKADTRLLFILRVKTTK